MLPHSVFTCAGTLLSSVPWISTTGGINGARFARPVGMEINGAERHDQTCVAAYCDRITR